MTKREAFRWWLWRLTSRLRPWPAVSIVRSTDGLPRSESWYTSL